MAKRNKSRKARRAKKKEALLAQPDVAVTIAVATPEKEKKYGGGSMMVPPEREKYSRGKKVVDLVSRILDRNAKSTKERLVSEEQALRQFREAVKENPQILEDLSDEEHMALISSLPQKVRANIGLGEEPLDDIAELVRGMEPEEVAQNLELFDSIESIHEYTGSLNARDARKFKNSLSDEDKVIFEGELPDIESTLGPREVRGDFAEGGSMLVPTEMENAEVPVDTYPNIPPEEMAAVEASQLPDEQMEDDYVDFVMNEALDEEEQMYLMNTLEADPQLSLIFDKVVTVASEFSGSGEVTGPGTGVSDSIPARLSDGEFVMTKKATDQIGADNLQRMMDDAERAYDGGLMRGKDEEEELAGNMNKVMMSSNQMPSLNVRQR